MAYLSIAEAISKHGRSDSSYRRLIKEVRQSDDARRRRLIKPSEAEIKAFRAKGQPYSYSISEDLIEEELLGAKLEQGSEPVGEDQVSRKFVDEMMSKMEQRHDKEVARLERQLDAERVGKAELLKYAQHDKELLAKAAESLTQVLALPGIAEATRAQTSQAIVSGPVDRNTSNDRDRGVKAGDHGSSKKSSADSKSRPKDTKRRRSLLGRVFARKR